jgi:hypothetical protein
MTGGMDNQDFKYVHGPTEARATCRHCGAVMDASETKAHAAKCPSKEPVPKYGRDTRK